MFGRSTPRPERSKGAGMTSSQGSHTTLTSYLHALEADVGTILKKAHRCKKKFDGEAINWGDVACVETAQVTTNDGEIYYLICIEEVSPDSWRLGSYIYLWLKRMGHTHEFRIQTAW
jgi:hypothetical protein